MSIIITLTNILALYRQTSPNWKVYFYPLDRVSFSNRLREVVGALKDRRFAFVEVFEQPTNFRMKVCMI